MLQTAFVANSFPLCGVPDAAAQSSRHVDRDELVKDMLPEVKRIARSIHERLPQSVLLDDLIQAGMLGLLDASGKYKASKNVPFKAYARVRVRGAILDSLRQDDWSPRSLRAQARRIRQSVSELQATLGREPDESEIAAELNIPLEKYQKLVSEIRGLTLGSFCATWDEAGEEDPMEAHVACAAEEDPFFQYSRTELKTILADAIANLPEKERAVLSLYYYEEQTMRDIGQAVGVVESRVSQLHSKALETLRSRLASQLAQ